MSAPRPITNQRKPISAVAKQALTTLRAYWSLIKSLQSGLLLLTGLAGYSSARCPILTWDTLAILGGSLFLAISGTTMLNMWYDRDIDAMMSRTCTRPLPRHLVSERSVLIVGLIFVFLGVGISTALYPLYGAIVAAGLFFDFVIYTLWLKRQTAWSILWGGMAGGMPVLAGRTLATGRIDLIGILLAAAVLFWIPTHIMTFSIRHEDDYLKAGIPIFPYRYGLTTTRNIIAISSIAVVITMTAATIAIGLTMGYLGILGVLSVGLITLALWSLKHPSNRVNFGLFKYASLYLLSSMALVLIQGL
jgi:protoheme IX farnesyltransferase